MSIFKGRKAGQARRRTPPGVIDLTVPGSGVSREERKALEDAARAYANSKRREKNIAIDLRVVMGGRH